MMHLLWLALALLPQPRVVPVLDQDVRVGPMKLRTLDIEVPDARAEVRCRFQVKEGGSGVRVVLLTPPEWNKWKDGTSNRPLASTAYLRQGSLLWHAKEPGSYVLVLDNRLEGRGPATVELQVDLNYPAIHDADPARAQIVVWSSVLLSLTLIAFSLWKIRRGWLRRSA